MSRDDDIAEALRPTFAREATAIAERIEEASASGRRDDVCELAHRLVGTAGTVHEAELVSASRELEDLAGDVFVDDFAVGVRAEAVVGAVRATVHGLDHGETAVATHPAAMPSGLPVVVAIEDNAANVTLFERIFERIEGVELVTAQNGREGARLVRERSAALVLLDLNLPDVSGEWVLDALREPDGRLVTRIVVVSAGASADHEANARRLGVFDYVSKPFEIARLRALVEDACAVGSTAGS